MSERTAVLLDVDGTLLDSNYLHAVAWWRALRTENISVPMNLLHATVGKGSDQFLPTILGEDLDPDLAHRIDQAHSRFYGPELYGLVPLPGARDLLRGIAAAGHLVVLASSCSSDDAVHLRAALDADDVIHAMTDSGDVDSTKPSPDLVLVALNRAGVSAERAVFVGDTVWDIKACEPAGVPCIALRCGGTAEADLRDAGAVAIYADPADLLARLASSAVGSLNRLDQRPPAAEQKRGLR